jgi:hypothetical protein
MPTNLLLAPILAALDGLLAEASRARERTILEEAYVALSARAARAGLLAVALLAPAAPPMPTVPVRLTPAEAAAALRRSPKWLSRRRRSLPFVRFDDGGRGWTVDAAALAAYMWRPREPAVRRPR